MDEAIGFLILLPTLVFGFWMVSYSGQSGLAEAQMSAAVHQAAHAAAEVLRSQLTDQHSSAGDQNRATERVTERATVLAEGIVNTAAFGVCSTNGYKVAVELVPAPAETSPPRDPAHPSSQPTAVVVKATCPLIGINQPNSVINKVFTVELPH